MSFTYGIIDIDNFGSYNLTHSFERGNYLLQSINSLLQNDLKPIHWKKLDGDEFLFTLNGDFTQNKNTLIKIMNRVDIEYGITLSIGIKVSNISYSFKEIIKDLRKHLLIAKQNGKNKICVQ